MIDIRFIKSRRMRWVVCVREKKNARSLLAGKPEGKSPFKNLGVDGKMILKYIFKKA